ncbi:MAG: hypothetical protein Q8O24_06715, partial [Gallionellaceae bacterium]|nr:hypothetical protein [Gallionellaceae bacterium]
MGIFTTLSPFCAAFFSRRRVGLDVWLLAALLLTAASAWAIPQESAGLPRENVSAQEDYSGMLRAMAPFILSPGSSQGDHAEVMRAIEAFPDVVVFPILVADSVRAVATRKLANKVAQAAGEGNIAVIYPDIGEPYRSVFTQI